MGIVWFFLALVIGVVLGHFVWPNIQVKEVIKEINVETKPSDYDKYLNWKKHEKDWINIKTMIPDETIEDDVKFEKIMNLIERELKTTDNGEVTPRKYRRRKK